MFNKVILIGRLGQNAEAKTAQNKNEYVILNIATQESWKNDKGDYENRTEWHRVYAWRNLSKFAKTLQKGQLITLEGILRYREVEDEVEGAKFKHRIAEIHAISMRSGVALELRPAPIDRKFGAGREGRVERKEKGRLRNFLRRPEALHGNHADGFLPNLGDHVFIGKHFVEDRRIDGTGRDRVDANLARSQLSSECPRERP